jgi:hypothetical protein
MFIERKIIHEIADELQSHFQFNLTSASPLPEIAESARDLFTDRGLKPQPSALLFTAKVAKAKWLGTIDSTKQTIES